MRSPGGGRVLLYHQITDAHDPVLTVPPTLFVQHLDWIASLGLRAVSVAQLVASGFQRDLVSISLDDGYRSAGDAAAALIARGWSGTLFVVPAWIDQRRKEFLSWPELTRLATAGIEVGAHGLAHEAPCGRSEAALSVDFGAARERIQDRLSRPVPGMAYPFGLAPRAAVAAARACGFAYACGSEPGANLALGDAYRLRRNEVMATDDHLGHLRGKLGGSDDWFRPLRSLENRLRCGG